MKTGRLELVAVALQRPRTYGNMLWIRELSSHPPARWSHPSHLVAPSLSSRRNMAAYKIAKDVSLWDMLVYTNRDSTNHLIRKVEWDGFFHFLGEYIMNALMKRTEQ